MTKPTITILAIGLLALASCARDEPVTRSSSTTTESTVQQPASTTTETQTVAPAY